MQASQAKNETRLPRAVLRRSTELNAKYAPPDPNEPDPTSAATVPPVDPSTPAAPNADTKPAPPADPRENDPAYWKQRFKVTAGVLDAERNARKEEVLEFNRRLTEMQEQIDQLQASAPSTPSDLGKYFTPEQVEEMGEEAARAQVTLIEKTVKEQIGAIIKKEIKPLQDQRKTDADLALRDRKAQFVDRLAEQVPDYVEIDTPESGFHAWLATLNDDGEIRQQVLDRHVAALNVDGAVRIFQAFKKTKQVPVPLVTPHGSGAGPSGDPPPPPNTGLTAPSDADIRTHFKERALGKLSKAQCDEFDARLKLRTG